MGVQRNADTSMAEPFAYNFRMNPGAQQLSGVAVPQVVQADTGSAVGKRTGF